MGGGIISGPQDARIIVPRIWGEEKALSLADQKTRCRLHLTNAKTRFANFTTAVPGLCSQVYLYGPASPDTVGVGTWATWVEAMSTCTTTLGEYPPLIWLVKPSFYIDGAVAPLTWNGHVYGAGYARFRINDWLSDIAREFWLDLAQAAMLVAGPKRDVIFDLHEFVSTSMETATVDGIAPAGEWLGVNWTPANTYSLINQAQKWLQAAGYGNIKWSCSDIVMKDSDHTNGMNGWVDKSVAGLCNYLYGEMWPNSDWTASHANTWYNTMQWTRQGLFIQQSMNSKGKILEIGLDWTPNAAEKGELADTLLHLSNLYQLDAVVAWQNTYNAGAYTEMQRVADWLDKAVVNKPNFPSINGPGAPAPTPVFGNA